MMNDTVKNTKIRCKNGKKNALETQSTYFPFSVQAANCYSINFAYPLERPFEAEVKVVHVVAVVPDKRYATSK